MAASTRDVLRWKRLNALLKTGVSLPPEQLNAWLEALLRTAAHRAEATGGPRDRLTLRAKVLLSQELRRRDLGASLTLLNATIPDAVAGLPATADVVVWALQERSFMLAKLDRRDDSYRALHQAITIAEHRLGRTNEGTIFLIGLLSNTYQRFGDWPRELSTATDAMERARQELAVLRPHVTLTAIERWYANALMSARLAETATLEHERARNIALRLGRGGDRRKFLSSIRGSMLAAMRGDFAEALQPGLRARAGAVVNPDARVLRQPGKTADCGRQTG